MDELQKRKILSVLCHASVFFSPLVLTMGIPIAILVLSDDPIVQENAKDAINFHINLYIYAAIFGFLIATVILAIIGIPLMGVLWVVSIVMPILAIVQVATNPQKPYRYPFIWHLL